MMYQFFVISVMRAAETGVLPSPLEQSPHQFAEDVIQNGKVEPEEKYRHNHHHGRDPDLLPCGPGHPLHFGPDVAQKQFGLFGPGPYSRKPAPDGGARLPLSSDDSRFRSRFFHSHPQLASRAPLSRSATRSLQGIGRGGGIRTPTSGFGDRRSAVKPTPLPVRPANKNASSPHAPIPAGWVFLAPSTSPRDAPCDVGRTCKISSTPTGRSSFSCSW